MRLSSLLAAAVMVAVPVFAHAAEVTPLVTAEWLKSHAGDENLVIVDIRDDIEKTDLGELPYIANAVVAPYGSAGWRTEVDGVPGQIPAEEQIACPGARIPRSSAAQPASTGRSNISAMTMFRSSMAAGASMTPKAASAWPRQ